MNNLPEVSLETKPRPRIEIPATKNIKSIASRDELTTINASKGDDVFNIGDLVWVKIPGYPYWPGMVTMDPIEKIHTKIAGTYKAQHVYHVQYFGEQPGRNWTLPGSSCPFQGPEIPKSKKPQVISKSRRKGHDVAIAEAAQALNWDPETRVKRLTYEYVLVDKTYTPHSTPQRRTKDSIKRSSEGTGDVYNFDESIDEVHESQPTMIWSRPRVDSPTHNASFDTTPPSPKLEADLPSSVEEDEPDESAKKRKVQTPKGTPKPKTTPKITLKKINPLSILDAPQTPPTSKTPKLRIAKTPTPKGKSKKDTPVISPKDLKSKKKSPDMSIKKHKKGDTPKLGVPSLNPSSVRKNSATSAMLPTELNETSNLKEQMTGESPRKRIRGETSEPEVTMDDMTSSEDASSTSDLETHDVRLDKLCNICHDEKGPFYFCSGTCLRTMHAECGGSESSNNNSNEFICQECKTGKHPCFVCKSTDGECFKCNHKNCGKYYHQSCLKPASYPASIKSETSFTCPLHYCLSCYTDQPNARDVNCIKPSKRQLVRCLSCPTAFHNDRSCIAAGTVDMPSSYVFCPAHRETRHEKHLNVSWCFSCNEGGKLICCESCPSAFHSDCLEPPPTGEIEQFFCYDCQRRKHLHYGDVIWIKFRAYRWWPGRITHPDHVPENIMKLPHERGDFPVYFFGTHDFQWSHRGRVFLFMEEDGVKDYGKFKSTSSKAQFKDALVEARQECCMRKKQEDERIEKLKNLERPRFKLIKSNRPVNNVQPGTPDDPQVSRCDCKIDGEVLCGSDECLNRLMMLECRPDTCPAKDLCRNQRFRKREYAVCVPFRTENAGWGLRTTQDIKKGDFVIEYVGELIDEAECQRRMELMREQGDTNFYFLTIDKERIIDAGPAANHARFMNHSCQPNCETQKWVVNGQTRVGLFAINDIPAGSELTFNYNLDCRGNEKTQCRCNSANCSGFIGVRPKDIKNDSRNNLAGKGVPSTMNSKSAQTNNTNNDVETHTT